MLATALSSTDGLRAALIRKRKADKAAAAHREAGELWGRMQGLTRQEWRDLVTTFPEYRSWALVLRVCDASVRAAAHDPADALELARFALFLAEQVQEDAGFTARLQGLVRGFVANALRVLEDFAAADAEFGAARKLWEAGADPDGLLPAWRLDDLEASCAASSVGAPRPWPCSTAPWPPVEPALWRPAAFFSNGSPS